tara:strand:+ start:120 stop:317 length:198 start_codon:yes stop_codon:yes gene_type:complete
MYDFPEKGSLTLVPKLDEQLELNATTKAKSDMENNFIIQFYEIFTEIMPYKIPHVHLMCELERKN